MLQFLVIRLLQKWNYNTIFQTREQNFSLVAKNSHRVNLKSLVIFKKTFFIYFFLCDTLQVLEQKFMLGYIW